MYITVLIGGILALITGIVIGIKAVYKKDFTLIGKLLGLIYILVSSYMYLSNPNFVQVEALHLGIIIYLLGDLLANLLYFMMRKQDIRVKNAELLRSFANLSEKYYSIVENTPIGFYVLDSTGRVEYVNSYLCSILGYTKEEVIGKSVFDFIHNSYKELARKNIARRMEGEVKTLTYVLKMLKKSGESIFVKVAGTRTENGHATITGWKIQLLS